MRDEQGFGRVGVFYLAVLQGGLMALSGLSVGVLYSFGGAAIDLMVTAGWLTSESTPGLSYGTALAFLALVGMPVLFGACGLCSGFVAAILYNLVAGAVGEPSYVGEGPNVKRLRFWIYCIGGSACVCSLIGAAMGGLLGGGVDVIEDTFGGAFFGSLIGGCVVGNLLGITRPLLR